MTPEPVQIVWFKRDLRAHDHAPLLEAARRGGPVLPLYVVEPGFWREPDAAGRHWAVLRPCLEELRAGLAALGQPLVVRTGEVTAVLDALGEVAPIGGLWSHEETGNAWTHARDRRVAAWARARGVPWEERRQTGVVRRLPSRDGWARRWDAFMLRPQVRAPRGLRPVPGLDPGPIPAWPDPALPPDPCPGLQPGGRRAGLDALDSFLRERALPYRRAMSTPAEGARHCSRLSPHLASGALSLREVFQAVEARLLEVRAMPDPEARRAWAGALASFGGRLRWHCHFMQKLESQPRIEFENFHAAYDGARGTDPARLAAWADGRTGWPFVDACMRFLRHGGWLNFRMRAMLMAVASYQLWLDWREPGLHLARAFADYEPGIHWPQAQMQSGTTGINTVRIYNPEKQGRDHDPDGRFVRRWVPELARVPDPWLHAPWRMPAAAQAEAGCRIDRDYPRPAVDHLEAARRARDAVWGVRRSPAFAAAADGIQARHGSRRSGLPQPDDRRAAARRGEARRAEAAGAAPGQLDLGF